MNIQQALFLSAALATLLLVSPLVCLQIGPKGYEVYGPGVPDIYILGGTILGKDRTFWGINFAYKFQLIVIIGFIAGNWWAGMRYQNRKTVVRITITNAILLFLFPFWLSAYINGVICNSDGADLILHAHIGLLFYFLLLVLNIVILVKAQRVKV